MHLHVPVVSNTAKVPKSWYHSWINNHPGRISHDDDSGAGGGGQPTSQEQKHTSSQSFILTGDFYNEM
jgi:hypothetical protein